MALHPENGNNAVFSVFRIGEELEKSAASLAVGGTIIFHYYIFFERYLDCGVVLMQDAAIYIN
jgi:hypothetical protein